MVVDCGTIFIAVACTVLLAVLPAPAMYCLPAVVVDCDTIFTALIMSQHSLPAVDAFPRPVMKVSVRVVR